MKKYCRYLKNISYLLILSMFLTSCITYRYIRDEKSLKLEREIHGKRAGNVVGDSFLTFFSGLAAALTGVYVGYEPEAKNFTHVSLVNKSTDTLQVNMLGDQIWKDSVYCDFRDIRIPPEAKCRLLVPVNTNYNLYFSNTINSEEDDEMVGFNTSEKSKIILTPGMTMQNKPDSLKNIVNPEK